MHENRFINTKIAKAYQPGYAKDGSVIALNKHEREHAFITESFEGAKIFALHSPASQSLPQRNFAIVRAYDIFVSLVILLTFAVPTLLAAIIKVIADGFPLFYHSRRIGRNRAPFTVFKFRSMIKDQEKIQAYIKQNRSGKGFEKLSTDCELYTPVGRFFEKFQIVEILQIFNVFRGEMSIIGYRPLPLRHVEELEEELGKDYIAMRHSVPPGITGLSQIFGKMNLSNAERVNIENCYNIFLQTQNQFKTIFLNTLIIMETIIRIFLKKNVFMDMIINMLTEARLAYFEAKG